MPENNDGAKVCAEKHGDNCNDGSAGCINNEINNGAEGDGIDINMCMMGLQGCCVTRRYFVFVKKVTMRDPSLVKTCHGIH
ncbi:unnamed protein product [Prunus armeniaca]